MLQAVRQVTDPKQRFKNEDSHVRFSASWVPVRNQHFLVKAVFKGFERVEQVQEGNPRFIESHCHLSGAEKKKSSFHCSGGPDLQ